jgi:UvrD/REP helicase N-terminal domain/Nuclease-related domain
MAIGSTPTYGEKLLNRLLRDLPKKQFFYHYEPRIVTPDGSSKPDFVIVSALLGVVVLEVKDWRRLQGGSQQTIDTIRGDGTPTSYDNPIRTAEGYAYDLKKRFEERAELWEQYKGRTCLKFPWQVMVVLPRISQSVIQQFEKKGIWPYRTVIGREVLTSAAHVQQAIHALPWKYKLEHPMSLDILDIIREILNPSLVVQNEEGFPIGTLTRVQHGLISEPLYALLPKQMGLFDEDELSNEAMGIPENTQVRLVRGVAGSGKTLVLLRRVRHVAEQYPDARSLVLTFNVELAKDLKTRLNLPDDQVEVASFHKVCRAVLGDLWQEPLKTRDWLRKYEKEALAALGLSTEFAASEFAWRKEMDLWDDAAYLEVERKGRGQRLERSKREIINGMFSRYQAFQTERREQGESWFDWDDVALLALKELNHRDAENTEENTEGEETEPYHPLRGAYDAIFIDEAQDFAPSWMGVIRALLRPNGNLFICDDPSQSIFNAYSWPQKGLSVVGRSRVLRVPFRSTREISQAAHSLIEADDTLRQTEDRPEPDFTSYELGSGPLPALIACKDAEAETAFVDEKVRELLGAGAAPGQIAILCHAKWHTERWRHWREQGVYVQYFDKIKGLEFVTVFLPHLHDAFPHPDDPDAVTSIRRKVFTAMTRARWRLLLSYQGALPKPLEPLVDNMWCENFETVST